MQAILTQALQVAANISSLYQPDRTCFFLLQQIEIEAEPTDELDVHSFSHPWLLVSSHLCCLPIGACKCDGALVFRVFDP